MASSTIRPDVRARFQRVYQRAVEREARERANIKPVEKIRFKAVRIRPSAKRKRNDEPDWGDT